VKGSTPEFISQSVSLERKFVAISKYCGVPMTPIRQTTPEAYTEAEVRKFFAALTDERRELAFELLLKTGLREREMTTLEWSDLTFGDSPTVTVQARKLHLKFRSKTGGGPLFNMAGDVNWSPRRSCRTRAGRRSLRVLQWR
jgi:integrase